MATDDDFHDPVVNRSRGIGWYLRRPFEVALYESDEDVDETDILVTCVTQILMLWAIAGLLTLVSLALFGVDATADMMGLGSITLASILEAASLVVMGAIGAMPPVAVWKYLRGGNYE